MYKKLFGITKKVSYHENMKNPEERIQSKKRLTPPRKRNTDYTGVAASSINKSKQYTLYIYTYTQLDL